MLCPRCGLENLATAEHCARCGTPLVEFSPDRPWGSSGGSNAGGRGGPGGAGNPASRFPRAESVDESVSWLASALRGGPAPSDAGSATPAGGNLLPPWLSQPNVEQGRSRFGADDAPAWPEGLLGAFAPPEQSPEQSRLGDPRASGGFPSSWQPAPGSQAPSFPSSGRDAPSRGSGFGNVSDAALGTRNAAQGLAPGTGLKGGRYRLLQPFHVAPHLRAQGGEPPLMIALDGNLAGGRVLIQELPNQHAMTDGGEQVRRLVANRLQSVSEAGVTPKLLDQFAEGARQFLVFELPTGDLLLDRMHRARGPLDETTAIRHALQIVDALAVLERQQPPVLHGNLSPANVVLRPSGSAMLVGQSTVLMLPPSIASTYTMAGGVPGYAAPEQARGTATIRSDLYAVCAILQHAVTGSAPPPRANSMHPPVRRQNPNVSLELEEVLGRGLRPSATQRYASTQELRDALEPLAAGRRTLVPDELRDVPFGASLTPVRNARGQLELPHRRSDRRPFLLIALVLVLLTGLGAGAFYATMPHPSGTGAGSNPTPNQIASDYQSRGIGISGGELIFDTQLPDGDAKQAGARAVAANNIPAALAAYVNAESKDTDDAEAAIYAENLRILAAKAPYVTLVVGISLGADTDASRSELQGVFLLQQYVNHQSNLLPNGVQLRVEIANSGATLSDVTVVSGFLLNILQEGNAQHFVGLVGWPRADETQLAVTGLKPTTFPVVSPTASSDDSAGLGINFFPLVPADSVQGSELADAAFTQFKAQHVLVLADAKNAASVHTSQGFQQEFQSSYATNQREVNTASYTSGASTSLGAVVATANVQRDDLIFVACGDNCDASIAALAQSVAAQLWLSGTPPNILVDGHGYTSSLVGLGTTDVAQFVRDDPSMFKSHNVYVTIFADANVWNDQTDLGPNILYNQPPLLQGDYTTQFGSAEPNSATILSYDAAHILIAASSHVVQVQDSAVGLIDTAQVDSNLLHFTSSNPFMGVSGAIGYGYKDHYTGWMSAKALFIEQLLPLPGGIASDGLVAQPIFEAGDIVGGKGDFCGVVPNCKPS